MSHRRIPNKEQRKQPAALGDVYDIATGSEARLDESIRGMNQSLTKRTELSESRVVNHLEAMEKRLDKRLDDIQADIGKLNDMGQAFLNSEKQLKALVTILHRNRALSKQDVKLLYS